MTPYARTRRLNQIIADVERLRRELLREQVDKPLQWVRVRMNQLNELLKEQARLERGIK
jgi:hypothetical protein